MEISSLSKLNFPKNKFDSTTSYLKWNDAMVNAMMRSEHDVSKRWIQRRAGWGAATKLQERLVSRLMGEDANVRGGCVRSLQGSINKYFQ